MSEQHGLEPMKIPTICIGCGAPDPTFSHFMGCEPARRKASEPVRFTVTESDDIDATDAACAWADYRADYGVPTEHLTAAHKAFMAGWKAAREGDQSGVLR